MKKMYLLVICVILMACSQDDTVREEVEAIGDYSLSGKFLAPNQIDPISNANVTLFKAEQKQAETLTNSLGEFNFEELFEGSYSILLEKGHFSSRLNVDIEDGQINNSVDVGNIDIQEFPRIGVVTGSYDNIENILYDMGLVNPITNAPLFDIIEGNSAGRSSIKNKNPRGQQHNHFGKTASTNPYLTTNVDFTLEELLSNSGQLAEYDILFFNCGLDTANADLNTNVYDFVNNGGILYATDWAFPFIEQINSISGNAYLTFTEPHRSGVSVSTEATILDATLSNWLVDNFGVGANGTLTIDEFLGSWQVVDSHDETQVLPWLNGSVEYMDANNNLVNTTKNLAFTYQIGEGGIFYSSFHTENNEEGFSDVDRIMEYMVFELSTLGQAQE
ncbi:carboxypeptidase-like regulatory domain-containing protein [Mesonia ostreae]|uniref:Carboxypeptidase-like regulatory domain-containing protein n=1 Tax=Mesonia ostreae TaxID=861110 RepID=A0ABU2KGK4_9FLAO|nr:carboxypeptidase-like regulatory domain-containing protein [Mesonia ostreae]MDT0293842.1 carboxypeptidase-like regulatory domain-containing protein [Mesonia ostreae]